MIEAGLLFGTLILIICAYLVVVFGGALFVGLILKFLQVSQAESSDTGLPKAGAIVGMLERAIILTFGLLGEYGAISFVFVAKSMARFKQLENRQFAEYYLIGTLISFFIALIIAIVTQSIFTLFLLPLFPEANSFGLFFLVNPR